MATVYAIARASVERPCRRKACRKPTWWRAVYLYDNQTGGPIPYCLEHLAKFATDHHLDMPKEAVNA
jgi:hypothetical protein